MMSNLLNFILDPQAQECTLKERAELCRNLEVGGWWVDNFLWVSTVSTKG